MYSPLYNPDWSEIFKLRLQKAEQRLRAMRFSTREQCQAALYSELNAIFSFGNKMTPLRPITPKGPALVGDVQTNFQLLNEDVQAIVSQLTQTEQTAARLLNLFASTQNSLRQQIRERVFQSTHTTYIEPFINVDQLTKSNAEVDFNAGLACAPLVNETAVVPVSVRLGPASEGTISTSSALPYLNDGRPDTVFTWTGGRLELAFELDESQIINRIRLELDDYAGLSIEALTTSPDGNLREDILAEIDPELTRLDSSSGKFTGDCIIDFDPKHAKAIRLVIVDRVGRQQISLRSVEFFRRQYLASGLVQSTRIDYQGGPAWFSTKQKTADQLTAVTHLISPDGVHYRVIRPDTLVDVPSTFWYRALFERIEASFSATSNPLDTKGGELSDTELYKVRSVTSVDLGGGITERTINFSTANGPVALREKAIPGTLTVLIGSMLATPAVCTVIDNQLNFQYEVIDVSVRYQTASLGTAALLSRKDYYSPYLYEVRLERQ